MSQTETPPNQTTRRILITGGHLTPALAVIDHLQQNHPDLEIHFAGIEYTQQGKSQRSHEKESVSKRDIPFHSFQATRLFPFTITNALSKVPQFIDSIRRAHSLLGNVQPNAMLSFGSYVAVPIALAAKLRGIPIITHEQTTRPGLATRVIALLADAVAASFKDTPNLPEHKTTVTGNPIRGTLLNSRPSKPDWFSYTGSKPLLYITGGGQGSEIINTTVARALPRITRDWSVVHQCGRSTSVMNYKSMLERKKKKLSHNAKSRYFVREWISGEELAWVFQHTEAMVSRSGANTVQELSVFSIPSILIPLPFSRGDEQLQNAKRLAETGAAIILEQKDLNPESLVETLKGLAARQDNITSALEEREVNPTQAATAITELVYSVLDA